MPSKARISVSNKILLAAWYLEKIGKSPFTAEDLVVSAWKSFPNTFGLRGNYNSDRQLQYPDSNRVFAEIMGSKPLRNRGLLVKVGKKMYQLTESGRDLAMNIEASITNDMNIIVADNKTGISREIISAILRLSRSRAVHKVDLKRTEDLTFHDACVFWGITPQSSAIELHGRLSNIIGIIEAIRDKIGNEAVELQHGGEVLSPKTLALIEETHNILLQKFDAEIQTIKRRKDER